MSPESGGFLACRWKHLAAFIILVGLQSAAVNSSAADIAAVGEGGHRWALLIGVDDYAELGKLSFAGNDQRSLAEQLVVLGFPQDQVFLLHDKATENKYRPFRENIEKQLELVLGMTQPNDLVIVGFSGHGVELEGKSYFCPVDARLDKLTSTAIPLNDVYARISRCRATLKLLLVDACRNGLVPAGRRSLAHAHALGDFAGVKEAPPAGILLLSSCGPGQVSMEDAQFGHGVFMHYVLEGLRGRAAAGDGAIALAGLYNYASLETKKYVARRFNESQTPALRGEIDGPFEICRAAPTGTPEKKPVRPAIGGEEFVSLFDGQTLEGWHGDRRLWRVADGSIVGSTREITLSANSFLVTDKSYRNFEFQAKVAIMEGNSGIQFRSRELADFRVTGLQAEVNADPRYRNIGLWHEGKNQVLATVDRNDTGSHLVVGQWNEYTIICDGPRIILEINGHRVVDYVTRDSSERESGVIALQLTRNTDSLGTTVVAFRDLRIRELP